MTSRWDTLRALLQEPFVQELLGPTPSNLVARADQAELVELARDLAELRAGGDRRQITARIAARIDAAGVTPAWARIAARLDAAGVTPAWVRSHLPSPEEMTELHGEMTTNVAQAARLLDLVAQFLRQRKP